MKSGLVCLIPKISVDDTSWSESSFNYSIYFEKANPKCENFRQINITTLSLFLSITLISVTPTPKRTPINGSPLSAVCDEIERFWTNYNLAV